MTRGGARPGAGRPALGDSPTRNIPARAAAADIERWQAQAASEGLSFAEWVRQALDAADASASEIEAVVAAKTERIVAALRLPKRPAG